MKEALYFKPLDGARVECLLCPQHCRIPDGSSGLCKGRVNKGGVLFAESFGRATSVAMDPIEKKPLYHFFPGRQILSVGTYGCNLRCTFCQNSDISQLAPPDVFYKDISPGQLVDMASEQDSVGIAYTYNEPLIWFEYVLETSRLARTRGLANVLVTNGYVNPEPLTQLLPWIDAMNIDIKSFSEKFYSELSGASLEPVLNTVRTSVQAHVHVETTTLIIPGYNNDPSELESLASWIADNCGPDTPAHVSAYFPRFKLDSPPTSVDQLTAAFTIFRRHLKHVYMGNVLSADGSSSVCSECGAVLVERTGYRIRIKALDDAGICSVCGAVNRFTTVVKPPPASSDK